MGRLFSRDVLMGALVAVVPVVASSEVPQSWSCRIESVFFTNGTTGTLEDTGDMFVGKTLIVELSTGQVRAPDGPQYYEIAASSSGTDIMTFSTTNPLGTATIVDVSSARGTSTDVQFTRVFMLRNKRGDGGASPFQLVLPSEIATGLCEALNA